MADSSVLIDPAFSVPSTKTVPNGHTPTDSHAAGNGGSNGLESNSFEDCFMDFDSNGGHYEGQGDIFDDELELERIRHLSTIVEGPAENSNSSSDNEESDYIQLNQVSFLERKMSPPAPNPDNDPPSIHNEDTPRLTNPSPSTPVEDSLPVDSSQDTFVPTPSPKESRHLEQNSSSPTEVTLTSPAHDYDVVETFHRSTTSPTHNSQANETHNTASAACSTSTPEHPTTSTVVGNIDDPPSIGEREVPSPQGFLDVLSSVLAAPPMLDESQGQLDDDALMKGTLGQPLPIDWSNEDMLAVEGDILFTNLLPPIDSCQVNQLQSCLDVPAHELQRSISNSSNEYVNIADLVELPSSKNGNQAIVKNEAGSEVSVSNEPQVTANDHGTVEEPSQNAQSGSTTPVPMSSPQRDSNTRNETSDTVTDVSTPSRQETPPLSSNLDRGKRPVCHTVSSPGGSPVVLRRRIGESPLARRKNITSSPVHPRGDLGVLQPLSPEHGTQMSDQYDFLRRTLSHSHRRYSTRRRPNRKGRNRPEESGAEGENATVQSTEDSPPEQQRWRDILISTEVTPTARRSEDYEMHVDHHGRMYVMDHRTRTIAFDGQRRRTQRDNSAASSDLDTRRQMLDRRYQSLNRSFRRNERPTPSRRAQRERFASPPATTSSNLEDNMSLTLTRAEADAMLRGESTSPGRSSSVRSKSKKKRNSTGSSRRWPFSRKSSKSITQQNTPNSGDDILVVGGDLEISIPGSPARTHSSVSPRRSTSGSVDSEGSLTRSFGGTADESVFVEGVASEQVVRSVSGGDETVTEQQQGTSDIAEPAVRHTSPEISDLDRQDSIVRSSWLSRADRSAAQIARSRASSRRQNSDETPVEVTEPGTPDSLLSPIEVGQRDEEIEESEVKEKDGRQLSKALTQSPVLKFVTRRDLFSFLSSAGEAGKAFISSRALMELVQRIRSDNFLLEKYQHSRHLVNALNRFANQEADLPEGWEKKLNQQGKVFFIDHKFKVTTFIDPRLPLPDTVFTYTTREASNSMAATRRSVLFEDQQIRPHHVTTVSTSSSVSEMDTPPRDETTPTPSDGTPTPSEGDGSSVSENSVGPPTYEAQVVAFFRKPDVVEVINSRYQRGVRPQFRNIIEEVRLLGVPALERIQLSGSIAAYELALVLSLFEDDIGRIQLTVENTTAPTLVVVNTPQQSPRHPTNSSTSNTKNTLQRKKEAFSTKLQHFKIMMVRLGFAQGSRLKFNIRRDHLLEDAYEHVMKSDIKHLQTKRLNIAFKGEEGLDYGGPSREFFFLLSREIFNPYYGLFEYSANDTYTVQVNPTSEFLQNSADWFRFAGRIMGLVIVQGFLLDAFFTRTLYKNLLSRPPTLKDLEPLEPDFYNSLLWIRENDPEPLDLTFTVEDEAFGELRSHELKEGGLDLPVTEDNKELYITLMLKWRLDRGVAKQMEVLKKGFAEVMPPHLLVDFDASELEFITAGTVEIDVEDWRTHTEYRNGYHPAHPVIMWFWKAVEIFTNEQRLRLLQFVTGTSSVPFEGFKALRGSNGPKRFTIDYFNDANAFPRTHTCFNRIDLPPYSSYDTLYDKLLFAVQEGGGFGIE